MAAAGDSLLRRDPAGEVIVLTSMRRLQQPQMLRSRLDRVYERMESIGTPAGEIAHDLKQRPRADPAVDRPLQQDDHDAERLETLAAIEASAKRGAAMVGRVLSFARGAGGRREQMQVPPLIRDSPRLSETPFRRTSRSNHPSPDLWALQADAIQLHQVLLNLCVNARDAMPAGGQITLTGDEHRHRPAHAALNIDAQTAPM